MKKLLDLISPSNGIRFHGNSNPEITSLTLDSRMIQEHSLFAAFKGTRMNGHQYISAAIEQGAVAILCEELPGELNPGVVYLECDDSRETLGQIAAAFYDWPSEKLKLIGVTGTNGKTSIATWLYELTRKLGYTAGLLSTIRILIEGREYPASHTTPDVISLNRHLAQMVQAGCEFVFMEVSSHALEQKRVAGVHFTGAIFTNLTRDHLDYHPDFAAYLRAKKRLFDGLDAEAFALIAEDDKNGRVMVQNCAARIFGYAINRLADFQVKILEQHPDGMSLLLNKKEVWARVIGRYNGLNLAAVYGAARLLGLVEEEILPAMSALDPVEGRMEIIDLGRNITGIVDYAHTPDALVNVLGALGEIKKPGTRIITVIGAGGDRDPGKRPNMTLAALEGSDQVILTADNPRSEDPEAILDDMERDLSAENKRKVLRIADRRAAIKTAVTLAQGGDLVLVAGKGHENYQEIKGVRYPFDDCEELKLLTFKG